MDFYNNSWFQVKTPNPLAHMRLFCFPYAGGSASIYYDWSDYLPRDVEVIALQYPGRGRRFAEPLIFCCDDMVSQLKLHMSPLLDKPFAFFGHSSGGLVSFELARSLQRAGNYRQIHQFISAKRAVHLPRNSVDMLDHLSNEDLISKLENFGGTPKELLENRDLIDIFLPILRADFSLSETFIYQNHNGKNLKLNATLIYGMDDNSFSELDLERWSELINGEIDHVAYDGDHFFINSHKRELTQFLNGKLLSILESLQQKCLG